MLTSLCVQTNSRAPLLYPLVLFCSCANPNGFGALDLLIPFSLRYYSSEISLRKGCLTLHNPQHRRRSCAEPWQAEPVLVTRTLPSSGSSPGRAGREALPLDPVN